MKPRLHGWHLPVLHRASCLLTAFFLPFFFNDRCCVSATRGTRYVTFPAVSAAAVEAATTGTGIITGNSVCDTNQQNSAACCCQARLPFSVQVRLSVIGTQLSGTFHDQVNCINLIFFFFFCVCCWQPAQKSLFRPLLTVWLHQRSKQNCC